MSQRRRPPLWTRLVAAALSFTLSIAAIEVALRALRSEERFYPYHAGAKQVFYPSEEVTPGVEGTATFSTNSYGTRGPELGDQRIRLLTVGGSTTACTVLDDQEAWPFLLMRDVNQEAGDPNLLWVTNSGIDGMNSQHHLMHAKYLVPRLPRLDFVLVYAGLNDVGMWLYDEHHDPRDLDDPNHWSARVGEAFRVSDFTPESSPWYQRLEIWNRLHALRDLIGPAQHDRRVIVQDAELRWIRQERANRAAHGKSAVSEVKRETLPAALDGYADTLRRIASQVKEYGAEPVFVAQFTEERSETDSENPLFWMGAMNGGKEYARESEVRALVLRYNARMKQVAQETGALFIEPAEGLPRDAALFYDGVHLNERGAREFARELARQLLPVIRARDAACREGDCRTSRSAEAPH